MLDLDSIFNPDRPVSERRTAMHPARCVTPDDLPSDWHLYWDERAAIREYDGGFHREQAEALALMDVLQEMARLGIPTPSRRSPN